MALTHRKTHKMAHHASTEGIKEAICQGGSEQLMFFREENVYDDYFPHHATRGALL